MIISIVFSLLSSVSLSTEQQQIRKADKFAYIGDMPIDTVKKYKTRRNSWGDVIVSFKNIGRFIPNITENSEDKNGLIEKNSKFLKSFDIFAQNVPRLESILSTKYTSNFNSKFQLELWANFAGTFASIKNHPFSGTTFGKARGSNILRASVGVNFLWNIREWFNISIITDNSLRHIAVPLIHYDESIIDSFISLIMFDIIGDKNVLDANGMSQAITNLDLTVNSLPYVSFNFLFQPKDWFKISPSFMTILLVNIITVDNKFSYEIVDGLSIRALIKPTYTNAVIITNILSLQNIIELNYSLINIFHFNLPVHINFVGVFDKEASGEFNKKIFLQAGINPNIVADWEFSNNFYLTGKVAMNYDFYGLAQEDKKSISSFLTSPVFRFALAIRYDTR